MWWRSCDPIAALIAVVILFSIPAGATAQSPDELLDRMRDAYQDRPSVYLKRNTTYRIERTKQGIVAFRDVEEQELMLKDMAGSGAEQEVHYSGLIPLERLEAYTLVPRGKKHKRVPVGIVDHRDDRGGNIFHDDSRVASFVLNSLNSGSIGVVEYTLSFPDVRFVGGHYFSGIAPTEESTLTVISDPDIPVEVRMFHLPDSLLQRTSKIEKGRHVQRFTMRQVPPMRFESNAPTLRYYSPHAYLIVREPAEEELSDLDRLYRWYYSLSKEALGPVPAELVALADSIVGGTADPWEKAARIHGWVQDHVRYVAFEDGMNGLIPAAATEVCRVRYGDCKGMSNLLQQLLRGVDLQASLAWVGTRSLPYTYENLPTNSTNDHMIVALDMADTTLFLDPTASYNAFGVPSGFTQGKEALIAVDSVRFRVERIPVMPSAHNRSTDSVTVRIDGDELVGSGIATYNGYDRYQLAHFFRQQTEKERKESVRRLLLKGSNKFLLDSFSISGIEGKADPIVIEYHFRIPDQIKRSGDRIYLPIILSDPWKGERFRGERKLPIEFENLQEQLNIVRLQLPENARCITESSTDRNWKDSFGYDISIENRDDHVVSTSHLHIGTLMVDEELDQWAAMNNELLKVLGRNIVIELPEE